MQTNQNTKKFLNTYNIRNMYDAKKEKDEDSQ